MNTVIFLWIEGILCSWAIILFFIALLCHLTSK
jgi:hypothetical protein